MNSGNVIATSRVFSGGLTLLICLLFLWVYADSIQNLLHRWLQYEEYSHGFFIPLISAWMLWLRREAIVQSVGAPSLYGFGVLVASLAMLVAGELTALYILMHLSTVVFIAGVVLSYGGFSLLRVCGLPIAFLLFAIPMPYFIDAQLSWWLQLQSSSIGVAVLRFLGVSVYLQGNVIDLGNYALQVVEACSGLRYLYPLSSLGFLLAYLFQAPMWQRALVFLAVMPITVLMNSLRIAVIGALVNTWGNSAAEGFLHFFEGWVIFMTCAVMLLATMWLLDRLGAKRTLPELLAFPPVPAVVPRSVDQRLQPVLFITAALLVCGVGLQLVEGRQELKPERVSFRYFPLQVDEWVGRESFLGNDVENVLGASDYLLVDYYATASSAVNLYISYYESQRKGASPHSPRVCMPGGGWVITDFQSIALASQDGTTFPVNRAEIELNDQRQLVYYWFEQRGRRISNEYAVKWFLFQDSLIMNRTDGALVRVSTLIDPNEPGGEADQRLRGFLSSISALLPEYVPGD